MEELRKDPETDIWHASFEVSSISRSDVVTAGLTPELAASLTDEQMTLIAAKMGDYYTDQDYWEHLMTATEYICGASPGQSGSVSETPLNPPA